MQINITWPEFKFPPINLWNYPLLNQDFTVDDETMDLLTNSEYEEND